VTHLRAWVHCRKKSLQNTWQQIAFFCRKLILAFKSGEFLPIYEAVKHFQHMIQSRHFFILTVHMPIIFAFQQKTNFRHGILTNWMTSSYSRREYAMYSDRITSWPTRYHALRPSPHPKSVWTVLDWNTTPRLEKVSRHLPALLRQIWRKFSVVRTST
jgi:hypothetical protein